MICTVGEMNLALKAFNVCLFARFCMQSIEKLSFIFIYLKNNPFYFDGNSFCLIILIPILRVILSLLG